MGRILIIEDNHENLNLMSYLLSKSGYEVVSAMDGEDGLSKAATETPDLIICDIQIPKIDGLEVIKRLKSSTSLSKIPVIAITAYAMVGDRERILQTGCNDYISKPIQPEIFVSQIEAKLPTQKIINSLNNVLSSKGIGDNHVLEESAYRGTVLIVDDSPADLYLSEMLIRSIQLRPVLAHNIFKAIELIDIEKPNLILSDYHLNENTALDLIAAVKNKCGFMTIPFIVISSSLTQNKRQALRETKEIEDIITRPIEPELFLSIIESAWLKTQPSIQ